MRILIYLQYSHLDPLNPFWHEHTPDFGQVPLLSQSHKGSLNILMAAES